MSAATRVVRLSHDETRMFGLHYPLLAAYPEVVPVCMLLPAGHRWHRRRDRLLVDLGVDVIDDDLVCIRRIDPAVPWEATNVAVVEVPEELRWYHLVEREAWLEAASRGAR